MSVAAMPTPTLPKKMTVPVVQQRKGQTPLVMLTAYTTPMAKIMDAHVDMILVGDSVGMVMYGFQSTLPVTLDMMINHGAAVVRGATRALVVVDMPFGTYHESKEQAFRNASRVMIETGCDAVKLEGGIAMADTVRFLAQRGIPVMGHVGLMPQSINTLGGYGAQGRGDDAAGQIFIDARAIADAGAFAIVLEGIVEPLAADITRLLPIPTIGIGASPQCDGQVLVSDDMLGLFTDFKPKFVQRYAHLADTITSAITAYAHDVQTRAFPAAEHCFASSPAAIRNRG